MVDFPINTGIRKIADKIITRTTRNGMAVWLTEDITIILSNSNTIATIVVDFAFSVPTIVEYNLLAQDPNTWVAFNNGEEVVGGQSRFIDVTDGAIVNFRATKDGDFIRIVVSSVP